MQIRNVAIIAHVDHGKTTLVDGLLKQAHTFRENEAVMSQTLIMDSNDQERERGITILAKNTAVMYKDTKINIVDTPGHADFSGEVERTLNMADGVVLVIDAQEGPMPQTKFVLKKAFELGLKPIVVINKIDKRDARVEEVLEETNDLFLELATHDHHLEFPILYAIGRDGKAWNEMPADPNTPADLTPIFEAIIKHIPPPFIEPEKPFQILIAALDWDDYRGKYAVGKVRRGVAKPGMTVAIINKDNQIENTKIDKVFVNQGLKREEVQEAVAGDIVALTGLKNVKIGDTVADSAHPDVLPTIAIQEPTLKMSIGANTSPFAGREGQFVTSRQILDRINKELETNVSMKFDRNENGEYVLCGRGELHLSVFIETLRREGYELEVGKPHVITKMVDGVLMEPIEELTVDVETQHVGTVTSEIGRRRGVLLGNTVNSDNTTHLTFEITTRGLIGLRSTLMTASRGTAVMNSQFLRFDKMGTALQQLRNGVLISSEAGKTFSYGLNIAQGRGTVFVAPQTEVYEGMIIGLNSREEDIEINVTKEKRLSNMRASGSDDAIILTPPTIFSLEQCLDFLEEDELLEVTPKSLRLRKKILNATLRSKAKR
jgi:GTP-binding protein